MPRNNTSVSREDYLKAIWEMLEENQIPISARLAEGLEVTPPTVTAALKRMACGGHVRVERGGRISLTAKGRKVVQQLMLRHQLAEMLLSEVIVLSSATAQARIGRDYDPARRRTRDSSRQAGYNAHLGTPFGRLSPAIKPYHPEVFSIVQIRLGSLVISHH